VALVVWFVAVIVQTAWICDDAFITIRTIDNLLHGYGLRWNVLERVQTFTHPLWMALLVPLYAIVRDPYFAPLLLSALSSIAAFCVLVLDPARPQPAAIFIGVALIVSKAFTDYATSGLENGLTDLLLAGFCIVLFGRPAGARKTFVLFLLATLLTLNRLDLVLIAAPPLAAYMLLRARHPKQWLVAALPVSILLLWDVFAIVYYGSITPNTALAKLNSAVPWLPRMEQGLQYMTDSAQNDPPTLLVCAAGVLAAILRRRTAEVTLAVGALLYCVYVVWIGGDFMSGRFLSAPFLVCAVLVGRAVGERRRAGVWSMALLAIGLLSPHPPPLSTASYRVGEPLELLGLRGIVDERGFYYRTTGLLRILQRPALRLDAQENHADLAGELAGRFILRGLAYSTSSERVVVDVNVGMAGYYAGPNTHIIDLMATTDPLLARIPFADQARWRPGHLLRAIPLGYRESIRASRNLIVDEEVATLYDDVVLVTQGDLWSAARLRTIARQGFGLRPELGPVRYR